MMAMLTLLILSIMLVLYMKNSDNDDKELGCDYDHKDDAEQKDKEYELPS